MAKIYFKRILEGKMSIDDVQERWQDEVERMLEAWEAEHADENADEEGDEP